MSDTPSEEAPATGADLTPSARLRSELDELASLAKAGAGRAKLTDSVERAQAAAADVDAEHAAALRDAFDALEHDDTAREVDAAKRAVEAKEADVERLEGENTALRERVQALSDEAAERDAEEKTAPAAEDVHPQEMFGLVDVGGTTFSMPERSES